MKRLYSGSAKKSGNPPGTLVYTGKKMNMRSQIKSVEYGKSVRFKEREIKNISQEKLTVGKQKITWINHLGVHKVQEVKTIGEKFKLHPLVMEDIVDVHQRPKVDDYDDVLFVIAKVLVHDEKENKIVPQQLSIVLSEKYILSFQELPVDNLESIYGRLKLPSGKVRKSKSDYLFYLILDTIVDQYFVILEELGEKIEALEERLLSKPHQKMLKEIIHLKNEVAVVRRTVWPLRDALNSLTHLDTPLIKRNTRWYLRDVNDHLSRVIDMIEMFRESTLSMFDTYLSSVSYSLNQVMKVLTVIATIFIPLTFITGIYGMNFQYMPELKSVWGYPITLFSMVLISLGMVIYFKKKNWW